MPSLANSIATLTDVSNKLSAASSLSPDDISRMALSVAGVLTDLVSVAAGGVETVVPAVLEVDAETIDQTTALT